MLRSGSFCLPRERARAVPESAGGWRDPSWSEIRRLVLRCASEHEVSATVTDLRVFAQPTAAV